MRILNEKYEEVKRNKIGQICVRGKNVMKEYFKNHKKQKKFL